MFLIPTLLFLSELYVYREMLAIECKLPKVYVLMAHISKFIFIPIANISLTSAMFLFTMSIVAFGNRWLSPPLFTSFELSTDSERRKLLLHVYTGCKKAKI